MQILFVKPLKANDKWESMFTNAEYQRWYMKMKKFGQFKICEYKKVYKMA